MKVPVYNQEGQEAGTTLLPKEIFDAPFNPDLVHQVAVSQAANRRQIIANTKTRGEVSGGGKKPRQQKGTGKARVGSIRSPLWRKGGIVFGPTKEIIFKKKIPAKMRIKALLMVLSSKARDQELLVLDQIILNKAKTKEMATIIKNLKSKVKTFGRGSLLIALAETEKNIVLPARNLAETKVLPAKDLNVLDILSSKHLLITKEGVKAVKENFLK